jgi:hypothetical protein
LCNSGSTDRISRSRENAMCRAVKRQHTAGALAARRLLLAASAVAVIASTDVAKAEDVFVTKAPSIPFSGLIGPAYNWNGFYAGGHMGLAWGQSNWTAGPGLSGTTNLFHPIECRSRCVIGQRHSVMVALPC